jgi:hypothetical protein
MTRTVRQVLRDMNAAKKDLATLLPKLEAADQGNSNLAWGIRSYIAAVEKIEREMPASDLPL